ncbi:MAG: hypothetical protein ACREHG_02775 [Candidatus Saccharimonadales bacterium]
MTVTKKHTNEGIDVSDQHTAKPQHIPSKLPINQSIYPRPESTRISTRDKHGRFNGVDENEWLPKHVVISSKRRRSDDDDECEHERPTTYPRTKDALKNGDANDPEDSLSPQPQATDPLHGGDGEVDVNVLMRLFAANSSKIMARLGESSIFL